MPKGVEHSPIAWLPFVPHFVPLAVMPKGVEHSAMLRHNSESVVPLAVMPKGVEHRHPANLLREAPPVPLAVMPKGVEHAKPV